MNYAASFEIGERIKTKLTTNVAVEKKNSESQMSALKKGQQITGTIVSVGELVTINFNGNMVTAAKDILGSVKPGEVKSFEVINASHKDIELKLIDDFTESNRKAFKAAYVKDTDWEAFLAKKEQEAKQAEKEKAEQESIDKLEEIRLKLTEQDYMQLEEEGFPVESYTVEGLSKAIDRIKEDNQASKKRKAAASDSVLETISNRNGLLSFGEKEIANRLQEENLPATKENITKLSKALELGNSVQTMNQRAMKQLISSGAKPSVENIYKAGYSSILQQSSPLTEEAWSSLSGQVNEVITQAGYEVNNDNLESARWLLENELPLTEDTFTYKQELEELKTSSDQNRLLDQMIEGMKQGINPTEVALLPKESANAPKIVEEVQSIRPDTVSVAVQSKEELTIKNLVSIQEKLDRKEIESTPHQEDSKIYEDENLTQTDANKVEVTNEEYEEIKAKRQLEEIRLSMTVKAALQLEKKGFHIETKQLEEVVEALRELENNYYKSYFEEVGVEATEVSLEILKDTTKSVEALTYLPSYILGSTLSERLTQTIPGLLAEGTKLQADLVKAGLAYETLMTTPSSEYGDSIRKAFANMDSLLMEMDIENTQANQRAVRILGYNQMEITKESIDQVKAYDEQVRSLMESFHPAVTVRMIKEGINPLETPIYELNQQIDKMKEEQGVTSQERYSTYLRKLEKTEGISEQERNAYIGIYRLLYQVDKSDGAALGAVLKADRKVTLENLLTAVQTMKKGSLEEAIDDDFGLLQSSNRTSSTIASQLSSFLNENEQQSSMENAKEAAASEQLEYLERILKQVKEELSPQRLTQTAQSIASENEVWQQMVAENEQLGIWETLKNTSVEKLYEQLKLTQMDVANEEEVYTQKVQQIRELCKNAEQSIRFLNDYRMPNTPVNIMMANHLLGNGESAIRKLLKLQDENNIEKSENSLKNLEELTDTLIDKHSMEEMYGQIERDANTALNQISEDEKINHFKLAELKSMSQQLTFLRALSEKEYYQIPVETANGVTNINLTILRGSHSAGKVAVTVYSKELGNVKADFTLKEDVLKGFIRSDSRTGIEQLQNNMSELKVVAEENHLMIKQMDFGLQQKENDYNSSYSPNQEESEVSMRADTERLLYKIAKAFVRSIAAAENSITASETK